ncbi:MAG: HAD family hydrolase [Verrucomicrobiota bacterium]
MNLPIQLISTDFDGTIFAEFENPPIPRELQEAIGHLQRQGAKWVINTGRDMSSLMEALARSRIQIQPDYLVLVEREIHIRDGIRYTSLDHWNQACALAHEEVFEQVRVDLPQLTDWINRRFNATVYEDPYSPFCLIASNNDDADTIHEYLNDYCRTVPHLVVMRNDVYARLSHEDYNKGTALAELSSMLGVKTEHVFAAGDHLNDLPMLLTRFAAMIAAPSNAIPQVKSAIQRQQGYLSKFPHGTGTAEALVFYLNKCKSKE